MRRKKSIEELEEAFNSYKAYIIANGVTDEAIEAVKILCEKTLFVQEEKELGLKMTSEFKELINNDIKRQTGGGDFWELEKWCFDNKEEPYPILELYYELLKYEARCMILDSYFMYLEKKREPKERFYMPSRKQFLKIGLVQALQDMLDDKADILCLSMPPGSKKTTCSKFFVSGVIGWFPNEFNLFFSHSGDIARMYYDGAYDIINNSQEYTWKEIFPKLKITSTNAKMQQFNVGKYKPFQSLQCTSRGSNNAGVVRASKFLLVDDLIAGIEEALNKNMLDKLWNIYTVDARQRKIDGCKEIHIATRWSVHDVIGRIQRMYPNDDRVKVIAIPDIDPDTGESNFDYEFNGFTVDFFRDQELLMDDITYRCLYKNDPIEREGLLYHEDELRRYLELPLREPDAIIGVCDTKNKGSDFIVLPVMYQYDEDYYMVDTICDDSCDFDLQYKKMANMIVKHNMQQCEFESNNGGERVAFDVEKLIKSLGGRCNITTRFTESNKETKIIVNSDWVKKHVIFKAKDLYNTKDDYGVFMTWLTSYSTMGKNPHDDCPDTMANFCLYVTRGARVSKVEAMHNPFRSRY